ncbi:rab-GTPase-TBC domain protein (macronuclear) [Tetrahymena thermophila SB210]|uniref:Rab-GTPase-TBC domain protein n=1 Tax=Tetrahymena thermophila (strain SB210) TaxID=312017 RepID=I7M3Y2_TETTS|nr:rab-GTPase-TBC domain protein [Tetrahymena thermophila SB210]EAS04528.2 rab-GTPase-TBC domain protein [Tetrahymena thermophila SB210]|eukprot:XP_001024773.2 rab-GTPase-TBC domain protein [Tetrahymena thermophila SB210]
MGSICFKEIVNENSQNHKKRSLRSSIKTEDHQPGDYNNSDIQVRDVSSMSKVNIDNSFNKNNMIGAYFCGGSALEQNAISYHQRMQDFQQIMKKGQENMIKQHKKSKSKGLKQIDQDDLRKTLIQKFQIQMFQNVKHEDLQKCIKKGPPIKYRWNSWKSHLMRISNPNIAFSEMCKLYQQYNQQESKEEVQIEKDINRTFPSQPYFATKSQQQYTRDNDTIIGFKPLKRVLVSISNMYPHLGYCQGMNFILGFILMINGSKEDEAFWMFKVLAEHPDFMLMGLYENELPLLKFLEFVAKQILKEQCSELLDFFEQNDIPDSFWLTKWILTLFLYNFPVKICSRFWDYIITNDIFSIIKLFIPLLNIFKKEFMSHEDPCSFMECFTQLTQDEEKLTNPQSEFYLKINDLVKKADSYRIEKKTIAKYAIKYLNCYERNNEYAKLYSYYGHEEDFLIEHEKLLQIKIKQPHELSSVPEERDNCEYSSITKHESQLKKVNNSDNLTEQMESKKSIKYDQDSRLTNANQDEISHWQTAVDMQIKQHLQTSQLKKFKSNQDNVITYSDQQEKQQSLQLLQSSKQPYTYQEEISQYDTNVDMQQKGIKDLHDSKKINNNDESQYHERVQSYQSEMILNLPSNIQQQKSINQQENPERSINTDVTNSIASIESQDQEEQDSDESKDDVPSQDLRMQKNSSSNLRKISKKGTLIHEHQDTLTFDRESYNMFQSLMNRSIDSSLQKKESLGFHRSLDDSSDNQFHIEEQEIGNDQINREKLFQYKSQQNIVKSTLSSQYDLSKTDKIDHSPCFKKNTLEIIRKDQNLNNSTLSECNNKSEIQTYQMQ